MYFKAFDEKLQGCNGYQFEIGKTYKTDDSDDWRWFHYAKTIIETLRHYSKPTTRICEVIPVGTRKHFKSCSNDYWVTSSLNIVREIPKDEVYKILLTEKCPFHLFKNLMPPFEIIKSILPKRLSENMKFYILGRQDFSTEHKKQLLPNSYHKYVV